MQLLNHAEIALALNVNALCMLSKIPSLLISNKIMANVGKEVFMLMLFYHQDSSYPQEISSYTSILRICNGCLCKCCTAAGNAIAFLEYLYDNET